MTSGAEKPAAGTVDPGISLLTKIGDFVEPLTRFDRGHLTLHSSEHVKVEVAARQEFKVMFASTGATGNGPLPGGVIEVADRNALARASETQLSSARTGVPGRLAVWAEQHGENPTLRPGVADCFTAVPPVGFVEACGSCRGAGKLSCRACRGQREVDCSACNASGKRGCNSCDRTGQRQCLRCHGMSYLLIDKQESYYDSQTNSTQYRTVQERVPCHECSNGKIACATCKGSGHVTCNTCHGSRRVTCDRCRGSGEEVCEACAGTGKHHHFTQLSCAVSEALDLIPRTQEPEVASTLKSLKTVDELLAYSDSHRSTAEASAVTLRRDTVVSVPVTTVVVAVGAKLARVRGYGQNQEVRDYGNIAGMLLSDDLDVLEAALPFTKAFPPRTTSEMESALTGVLASEVNVTVAENAAKKNTGDALAKLRGVVSAEYVGRAAPAIRKGVGRVYWSAMMRGPVVALALPLLQIPVELLVRSQGANGQMMAIIGVMLLSIGGVIGAHMWGVQQVQKRIRPDGVPKMGGIVNKLGLTMVWLIAGSVSAILLTLAMSGLTNMLLPVQPVVTVPALFPAN